MMPIEQKTLQVHADLDKNCTFFAGERFNCRVSLKNCTNNEEKITSAFALLDGQMLLNGDLFKVELFTSSLPVKEKFPFFRCNVISQAKKTLVSELTLQPQEEWSCKYSFVLPPNLPSSCSGKAIKILYSLSLAFLRAGFQPITLKFNFRVFSRGFLPGEPAFDPFRTIEFDSERDFSVQHQSEQLATANVNAFQSLRRLCDNFQSISVEEAREMLSSQPLLPLFEQKMDLEMLSALTAESSSAKYTFEINKEHAPFAKLEFPRKAYAIGEEIAGSLTFALSKASGICTSVVLSLESYEVVCGKFGRITEEASVAKTRKVHFLEEFPCMFASVVMLHASILSHLTPSFSNKICALRYELRLEFKCCAYPEAQMGEVSFLRQQPTGVPECGQIFSVMRKLPSDSLECLIPIDILPSQTGKELFLASQIHIDYPNEAIRQEQ